jgi:hypothetical protein
MHAALAVGAGWCQTQWHGPWKPEGVLPRRPVDPNRAVEAFCQRALIGAALVPGNPIDKATTLATLSSQVALDRPIDQVDVAVAHGAHRQESFGPLALFFPVGDETAAVARANDSPFGLGGQAHRRGLSGIVPTGWWVPTIRWPQRRVNPRQRPQPATSGGPWKPHHLADSAVSVIAE